MPYAALSVIPLDPVTSAKMQVEAELELDKESLEPS